MDWEVVPNLQQEYEDLFYYWMNARHAIYLNRQAGYKWPWTDDPILQQYKFTNVYRELDAGTKWYRENFREPYKDHPELFVNTAMYRRYNWTGTAEILGFIEDYDADRITELLLRLREDGVQIFTGAHMLCGNIKDPETGIQPPTKVEQIFDISFRILWERRREIEPQPGDNLETAFNRLMKAKIPGFGAFINYEIISDLRWTRYLENADDIMTWANPGPGARRGIQRLYGYNPPRTLKGFTSKDYIFVMEYLLHFSPHFLADYMPPLEMRDVEHSLCEFDKYMRVKLGEGRPRSIFWGYSKHSAGKSSIS